MNVASRIPAPPLSRFVRDIWYCRAPELASYKERILPSPTMGILVNLGENELRWYESGDLSRAHRMSGAVLTGAYTRHFAIDSAEQRDIVGANFTPAGAYAFFAVPASEVACAHVDLDAVWGRAASLLRERLLAAATPEEKLRVFERALGERIVRPLARDPAVDFALRAFADPENAASVAEVTARLGMSARRFIRAFSEQVGLAPKLYCRVRRFQLAVARMNAGERVPWAQIAAACGFYDQAHMIHEFRAFSGFSPGEYAARVHAGNHVRLAG